MTTVASSTTAFFGELRTMGSLLEYGCQKLRATVDAPPPATPAECDYFINKLDKNVNDEEEQISATENLMLNTMGFEEVYSICEALWKDNEELREKVEKCLVHHGYEHPVKPARRSLGLSSLNNINNNNNSSNNHDNNMMNKHDNNMNMNSNHDDGSSMVAADPVESNTHSEEQTHDNADNAATAMAAADTQEQQYCTPPRIGLSSSDKTPPPVDAFIMPKTPSLADLGISSASMALFNKKEEAVEEVKEEVTAPISTAIDTATEIPTSLYNNNTITTTLVAPKEEEKKEEEAKEEEVKETIVQDNAAELSAVIESIDLDTPMELPASLSHAAAAALKAEEETTHDAVMTVNEADLEKNVIPESLKIIAKENEETESKLLAETVTPVAMPSMIPKMNNKTPIIKANEEEEKEVAVEEDVPVPAPAPAPVEQQQQDHDQQDNSNNNNNNMEKEEEEETTAPPMVEESVLEADVSVVPEVEDGVIAPITMEELAAAPTYLRSQLQPEIVNTVVAMINYHFASGGIYVTNSQLKDEAALGAKAKPMILLLINLARLKSKRVDGETVYVPPGTTF